MYISEMNMVIWASSRPTGCGLWEGGVGRLAPPTYPKWFPDMLDISEMQLLISEMENYISTSHNSFSTYGNSIVDICSCYSY